MRHLIIITLVTITTDIFACSCGRVSIIEGQKGSDIVFVGPVVKINEVTTREKLAGTETEVEYKRYEFIFKVTGVYKGKRSPFLKDTVSIVTTGGDADCGSWFDEQKKYLVYSYKTDKKLGTLWNQATDPYMTTSLCTRTKRVGVLTFFERLVLRLS